MTVEITSPDPPAETASSTSVDVQAVTPRAQSGRTRTDSSATPEVTSTCASAAPRTPDIERSTCCPSVSSVAKSSPKTLIARLCFDADTVLVHSHFHRLREVVRNARDGRERLVDGRDQFLFGLEPRPLALRFQQQVGVAFIDAHGFGGEIGTSDLDDHVCDFRDRSEALLESAC